MRCRVGRSPTSRNIALTSCHGHPVFSTRYAAKPVGLVIGGSDMVRVWVILKSHHSGARERQPILTVSTATYTQCQPPAQLPGRPRILAIMPRISGRTEPPEPR